MTSNYRSNKTNNAIFQVSPMMEDKEFGDLNPISSNQISCLNYSVFANN